MSDLYRSLVGGLLEEAVRVGLGLREVIGKSSDTAHFSLMVRGTGYLDIGCWVQDGDMLYCEVYAGKWRDAFNMEWFDLKSPDLFVDVISWLRGCVV